TCYTRSEHPADLRRVVLAAQELLGVPSAACGATAAELFGMRLPRRTTRAGGAAIHLEVERGSAPRRTALPVGHRRAPPATRGRPAVRRRRNCSGCVCRAERREPEAQPSTSRSSGGARLAAPRCSSCIVEPRPRRSDCTG